MKMNREEGREFDEWRADGLDIDSAKESLKGGCITVYGVELMRCVLRTGSSKYISFNLDKVETLMDLKRGRARLKKALAENVEQLQVIKRESHNVIVYKMRDGTHRFSIRCQAMITKEVFISRIHNTDGGLERNPHRQDYLDLLEKY